MTDQGVAWEESVMIITSALDPVNEYKTEISRKGFVLFNRNILIINMYLDS